MTQQSLSDFPATNWEDFCRNFKAAFEGRMRWKWDGRFGTVLAEFSVDDKEAVRTVVLDFMATIWNGMTMAEAPESIQTLNRSLGGMMPEQMLFTSDTAKDLFYFCAWWPWGNGRTISIRFAPFNGMLPDEEKSRRSATLKQIFQIPA